MVTVCTDPASIQTFYLPSLGTGTGLPGTTFSFQALGVRPMVFLGANLSAVVHGMCCVNSVKRLIFRGDCSKRTFDATFEIMKTSKLAENMKELEQP